MLKHLNLKGHLLTAISYMIPIVCGAGFLVAIGLAMGGGVPDALVAGKFTIWDALATMGGKALGLLPVVIATGLSYSIAGKPGIAPGFVVGLIANSVGSGFIGGILGGYIVGFLVQAIIKKVKVPNWIKGLMPTLIIPFVASLVSSLIPNHSYLSQLDVTYKTPDLMSHFLPPHAVSFTFCCSSIVFPR